MERNFSNRESSHVVHLQMMLSTSEAGAQAYLGNGRWRLLEFNGVLPVHFSKLQARRGAGAIREGHYYFTYPKIGQLLNFSTLDVNSDIKPTPKMIKNAYQSHKMTAEVAREEYRKFGKAGMRGFFDELEFQRKELARVAQVQALEVRKQKATAMMKPFKPVPKEGEEFIRQFLETEFPLRFKPLVYDGPTQFGKSRALDEYFGNKYTHMVGCQNDVEPDLREFDKNKVNIKALRFEECSWKTVYNHKLLFQAGMDPVDLGQSSTNCHAYRVDVYGTPMLVACNDFWKDCHTICAEREYLNKNILYYKVQAPLWEE
jgi:hypothetical protein